MKKSFIILFGVIIGLLLLACLIGYLHIVSHRDDWKGLTTPLPLETVETLCENLNLDDEALCGGKKDVYAPDFYDAIRESFRPFEEYQIESDKSATYDEVEDKIGVYKYECEPVVYQADGFAYFRCFYDLRGDRVLKLVITFTYPDNAVFRINAPLGNDD